MRRLTFLILIVAAIYSGYWFLGVKAVRAGSQHAITQAQEDGWDISYADLQTVGFPSRFDTTAHEFALTSPDGQLSWEAPFLQVFALSYQPNNVIAAFPPEQNLRIGDQTFDIDAKGLRASAKVRPNTNLSFQNTTVEMGATTIASDLGWSIGIQNAIFAVREATDLAAAYDVFLDVNQLVLPADIIAEIDPDNLLTNSIQQVVLDAVVTLDQPLDRHVQDPLPQAITLRRASLVWGNIVLIADGSLEIGDDGIPEGRITLKTDQWREIIDLLVSIGTIQRRTAFTITTMANSMVQDGRLELPISFQDGFMSVGPIPIGPAPRLR